MDIKSYASVSFVLLYFFGCYFNGFKCVCCRVARRDLALIHRPGHIHVGGQLHQPMTTLIHQDSHVQGHGKNDCSLLSFIVEGYVHESFFHIVSKKMYLHSDIFNVVDGVMSKAHSFPYAAEFQTELRNLSYAAKFPHFCGILQNLINDW